MHQNSEKMKMEAYRRNLRWILPALLDTYFLKAFFYLIMTHFTCSIAIQSTEVREDASDIRA